jgi:hypothetical protein
MFEVLLNIFWVSGCDLFLGFDFGEMLKIVFDFDVVTCACGMEWLDTGVFLFGIDVDLFDFGVVLDFGVM